MLEATVALKKSGTLNDVLVIGRDLNGGLKTLPKNNGDLFVILGDHQKSIQKIGCYIILHELLANGGVESSSSVLLGRTPSTDTITTDARCPCRQAYGN